MLKLNIDKIKFANYLRSSAVSENFLINFNNQKEYKNCNLFVDAKKKFSNNFTKTVTRNFVLYIPNKKLIFIKHSKYGRVYPVYIADENYNKKNNPKKLMPFIILISAINLYVFLVASGIFGVSEFYKVFFSNELIFLTSVFLNIYILRKYFKYLSDYSNRVRCMYLFPEGNKILLESFDRSVNRFDNLDIFNYNIYKSNLLDEKNKKSWKNIFGNNTNNFRASIEWGRNRENFFEGSRKILDYEIFTQILGRNNIDTKIQKFKKEIPIGTYSQEEKRKIMNFYRNKKFSLCRIDRNRLLYHYFLLRKEYIDKKKIKKIKDEFNFY